MDENIKKNTVLFNKSEISPCVSGQSMVGCGQTLGIYPVIINKKAKDVMDLIKGVKKTKETIKADFLIDWYDLIEHDIDSLNEEVDELFGEMTMGIEYTPIAIKDGQIVMHVEGDRE